MIVDGNDEVWTISTEDSSQLFLKNHLPREYDPNTFSRKMPISEGKCDIAKRSRV